jgi:adenylyltransferase/sulfurtransferase
VAVISDRELLRYSRQIMLPRFDVAAQEKLLASRVLVAGLGGLGSPVALYLAAAGVGTLVLADGDEVDASNLQRQLAHTEADVGRNKAESAAQACAAINSGTRLEVVAERLAGDALRDQVSRADLVVDATDSFVSRLDLNLACIEAGKPLLSGAAIGSEGQLTLFHVAAGTGCYRCLYPDGGDEPNFSCAENGVLAPVVGVIGSLQALEAVKLLAGYGEPLRGRLLLLDGWSMQLREVALNRVADCPHCSQGPAPAPAVA